MDDHTPLRRAWLNLVTAPLIYSVTVPLAVLDLWVTAYQWVCFPLYGIPRVPRGHYFVIDRHRLPYLSPLEKANCAYCGYATGVIAYVREVTARTERYWCPVKHDSPIPSPHDYYEEFSDYGDAAHYRQQSAPLRRVPTASDDEDHGRGAR